MDERVYTVAVAPSKYHRFIIRSIITKQALNQSRYYSEIFGDRFEHFDDMSPVSNDEQSIKATLLAYRDGLNTASVENCIGLYSSQGMCMPQHAPASTGRSELTTCYQNFFNMLKFDVEFDIKEVHVFTDTWAFARTTSAGTTTLVQNGQKNHEANQELFVMEKEQGKWKIARYCFCTTNPPK
ncbi:MAG: hypothetical protein M1828_007065 [Chrysothrix sp. TS-e1954]|nr:MAG: hypothetical protein M1828_007065 [Chrysothrix sp. TS-e1954]